RRELPLSQRFIGRVCMRCATSHHSEMRQHRGLYASSAGTYSRHASPRYQPFAGARFRACARPLSNRPARTRPRRQAPGRAGTRVNIPGSRTLLFTTAVVEGIVGTALFAVPSQVVSALLGGPLEG